MKLVLFDEAGGVRRLEPAISESIDIDIQQC